jgi:hypothetical protein
VVIAGHAFVHPSSAVDGHVRAWLVATWLVRGLPSA